MRLNAPDAFIGVEFDFVPTPGLGDALCSRKQHPESVYFASILGCVWARPELMVAAAVLSIAPTSDDGLPTVATHRGGPAPRGTLWLGYDPIVWSIRTYPRRGYRSDG